MVVTNADVYSAAQARIQSGHWRVDAEAGHVYGSKCPDRPMGWLNTHGYVQLTLNLPGEPMRRPYAHRVIWEFVHGPIAYLMEINHMNGQKDDNRLMNLEAVTAARNSRHAFDTGLKRGKPGAANGKSKLTDEQVLEIRAAAGSLTQRELAKKYGVSQPNIQSILVRRMWSHI